MLSPQPAKGLQGFLWAFVFVLKWDQSHCLKGVTTRHIFLLLCQVQGVEGVGRSPVSHITLRRSVAGHSAVLASLHWEPRALFLCREAGLCSFCLFDSFASFKSQPKSSLLTMRPLASSEDTLLCAHCPPSLLSLRHAHESWLAGSLPTSFAWLPQEGRPWSNLSIITYLAPGTSLVLPKCVQPQISDAQGGHASFQILTKIHPFQSNPLCVRAVGVARETHCSFTGAAAGRRKMGRKAEL